MTTIRLTLPTTFTGTAGECADFLRKFGLARGRPQVTIHLPFGLESSRAVPANAGVFELLALPLDGKEHVAWVWWSDLRPGDLADDDAGNVVWNPRVCPIRLNALFYQTRVKESRAKADAHSQQAQAAGEPVPAGTHRKDRGRDRRADWPEWLRKRFGL